MSDRIDNLRFGLLATSVAAVIATHLGHLPAWFAAVLFATIALRAVSRRRGAPTVPVWVRIPLAALLLAWITMSFGNVFGREPGSVLGCGLLALKLLETERVRDARVAVGFAAFVLMSALLFTQSLGFTALVCTVLVLLVATLVALQPASPGDRRPLRAEFRSAALLMLAGLPLAAAAFLLVPRLGSPLWGAPGGDMLARTGLSETMAPGQITELLISDAPALRASFDTRPPPAQQRYFRTMVLWDFDGTTWSRGWFLGYGFMEDAQRRGNGRSGTYSYEITLEPTDRRWLPSLDMPLDAPEGARLGADHVLFSRTQVTQPVRYRVRSATDYVLAPSLSEGPRARALALPPGYNPRTHDLARRWRAEGRDDAAIVKATLDLFRASFTYTLQPPLLGRDSVDDFLFGTRAGFCEHYSSAFVVLMRAAGIPARVVTGYQGGWWNESDAYLLVRQSDAHAWAEVWLGERGWVRVDPTAAVSPARIDLGASVANAGEGWTGSTLLRDLRNRLDVMNRLWTEGIIRFDHLRQQGLLTPFGVADADPADLMLALAVAIALVLVAATAWAIRSAPRRRGDALDHAWRLLRARLARAGIESRDSEGPLDLLARVRAQSRVAAPRLEPLVRRYVALRYGGDTDPERVRAFERAARRFRLPRVPRVPDRRAPIRNGTATSADAGASSPHARE